MAPPQGEPAKLEKIRVRWSDQIEKGEQPPPPRGALAKAAKVDDVQEPKNKSEVENTGDRGDKPDAAEDDGTVEKLPLLKSEAAVMDLEIFGFLTSFDDSL